RVAAYGTVDETNAAIGLVRLHTGADPELAELDAMLARIQNDLFDLGADLATPGDDFAPTDMALRIVPGQVSWLEAEIDRLNADLPPLSSFILPGGSEAAARVHVARASVRRAERAAVALAAAEPANPAALAYLNRLSDLLFVLARAINAAAGGDVLWVPGKNR
ncbi:MAG TPA: cob(I)yrinic acid a,c-diamide adenosyltransferase, partial [Novosphingobium sp.]|nr:cob(I)yrinic acid a,c-diamide adenosyltransferase [Novosphingobium sp.]